MIKLNEIEVTNVLVFVVVETVIILSETEPAAVPDASGGGIIGTGTAGATARRLAPLPQVTDQYRRIAVVDVVFRWRRVHGQYVARSRHFQFQFVCSFQMSHSSQ